MEVNGMIPSFAEASVNCLTCYLASFAVLAITRYVLTTIASRIKRAECETQFCASDKDLLIVAMVITVAHIVGVL